MDKVHHVTLVYLYGPPASGKLTVAERLAEQSGYRLFHNHLTVNAIRPVLDFGSEPFVEVLHRLRLDVFAAAAGPASTLSSRTTPRGQGTMGGLGSRRSPTRLSERLIIRRLAWDRRVSLG
jgi:hypothetical protein